MYPFSFFIYLRGGDYRPQPPASNRTSPSFILLILYLTLSPSVSALDFLFNSFNASAAASLDLIQDAHIDSPVIRLDNESDRFSLGRVFYRSKVLMKPSSNSTVLSSFSTSFVFSILPESSTSPGWGIAFVLSNSTRPDGALSGQYFGLFSDAPQPPAAPLLAVEFDIGQHTELADPSSNHIGIDLNNVVSAKTEEARYYNSSGGIVPVIMRNGQNIQAWIEFDGPRSQIDVTIAPVGISRPLKPLLSYKDQLIANYISAEMYVGFSASENTYFEEQRILAWSFSNISFAREINTTNLPTFLPKTSSSSLPPGGIAGITVGSVLILILSFSAMYWFWRKNKEKGLEDDELKDWEMEYWPHRFPYEELSQATNKFSKDELLGAGGFGRVYKGKLPNNSEVAVKCVNHDSKQGLREFMAEISSMGRLQHKNLVQMRGWCRKGSELLLVYDYMSNGSLNRWIFDKPKKLMNWVGRRRVLADVAEGLNYLHHGWDQVVIHRDIKSSNILLDSDMRGRLGDFGLAKLYTQGEAPKTTRVVGTLGYLAPEMATATAPTTASDVYGFGIVVLEVACGRRPIEAKAEREEETVLVDWVRQKYTEGRMAEAADARIQGEYEAEEMEVVLKLGLSCCHPDPLRRPTIREVAAVLLGDEAAGLPRLSCPNPAAPVVMGSGESRHRSFKFRLEFSLTERNSDFLKVPA
ncbi:Non-specific serine/threonine protein kinase [Bertholletia excelsa]